MLRHSNYGLDATVDTMVGFDSIFMLFYIIQD